MLIVHRCDLFSVSVAAFVMLSTLKSPFWNASVACCITSEEPPSRVFLESLVFRSLRPIDTGYITVWYFAHGNVHAIH